MCKHKQKTCKKQGFGKGVDGRPHSLPFSLFSEQSQHFSSDGLLSERTIGQTKYLYKYSNKISCIRIFGLVYIFKTKYNSLGSNQIFGLVEFDIWSLNLVPKHRFCIWHLCSSWLQFCSPSQPLKSITTDWNTRLGTRDNRKCSKIRPAGVSPY
jgi:hypothetical protein